MPLDVNLRDFNALWETVVGEAAGESKECQIAVAYVIMNRVSDKRYWPDNIYDVCRQPGEFECLKNVGTLRRRKMEPDGQAIKIWLPHVFSYPDPTNGCNHFCKYEDKEGMKRSKNASHFIDIGNRRFYRL